MCFPGFEPGPMRSRRKLITNCTSVVQLVTSLRWNRMGPGSNPGKHNNFSNGYSASNYDIIRLIGNSDFFKSLIIH